MSKLPDAVVALSAPRTARAAPGLPPGAGVDVVGGVAACLPPPVASSPAGTATAATTTAAAATRRAVAPRSRGSRTGSSSR